MKKLDKEAIKKVHSNSCMNVISEIFYIEYIYVRLPYDSFHSERQTKHLT